jgi:hypothetical protein
MQILYNDYEMEELHFSQPVILILFGIEQWNDQSTFVLSIRKHAQKGKKF